MKRILATALVIGCSIAAAPSFAQNNQDAAGAGAISGGAAGAVGGALVGGPVGAVVGGVAGAAVGATAGSLTPEDRVYVREYTTRHRTAPVMVREPIVVGQPLPPRVRYQVIEGNPRLAGYRYAYINDDLYLIDRSGRVIEEID